LSSCEAILQKEVLCFANKPNRVAKLCVKRCCNPGQICKEREKLIATAAAAAAVKTQEIHCFRQAEGKKRVLEKATHGGAV